MKFQTKKALLAAMSVALIAIMAKLERLRIFRIRQVMW